MQDFDLTQSPNQETDDKTLPSNSKEVRPGEVAVQTPDSRINKNRRTWLKSTLAAGAGLATFAIPGASGAQINPVASLPPPLLPFSAANGDQSVHPSAVTADTSYITFCGLDFRPANSSSIFDWNNANYVGIYPSNSNGFYTAKVVLPEQAQITEAEFYILHKDNTININCYLIRTANLTGTPSTQAIGFASLTTETDPSIQTVGLSGQLPVVVNNSANSFYFGWYVADQCNSTNIDEILYGARIGYTGGIGRFKAS